MIEPESQFIEPGRLRLHVNTWGDPSNPPVMLLHGMSDHSRGWDWIAQDLLKDYYLIAPDLRGHGDSDWAGADAYSLGAFLLDIADVMEAFDLQKFAIVGHSLGGALGLRLAAAFPGRVAALTGVECVTMPIQRDEMASPKPYPLRIRNWIAQRQAGHSKPRPNFPSLDAACARMEQAQPLLDRATIKHLVRHGTRRADDGTYTWKHDSQNRVRPPEDQYAHELCDVLDAVVCPTLLVYGGSEARPVPAPDMLDRMKAVEVQVFEGGCHALHHQYRQRFTDSVIKFLNHHYSERRINA